MGSLQGPAWLVPVARYQPQYARAIGRYALNAANSVRLLQGFGLDANHQDHARWKARTDPGNLFFYESLASYDRSPEHPYRPYATGDPVLLGWVPGHSKIAPDEYLAQRESWFGNACNNIALYMGNSVGFLGGIVRSTNVHEILRWDCIATDWFHPPAYPTFLYYNPQSTPQSVSLDLSERAKVYDAVSHRVVAPLAQKKSTILMEADSAMVLVILPANAKIERKEGRATVNGTVIDYHAPGPF